MAAKKDIRKAALKKRAGMSEEERRKAGRMIAARLFSKSFYEETNLVFCYASFREEVPTQEILEESLRRGKQTAVPKVTGKRKMEFFEIGHISDLKAGFQSIPEPGELCVKAPDPKKDTIVIVPGVAFDRKGNRIGYGGGYYDSYFKDYKDCIKIGIAFDIQCMEQIVSEIHDIWVDYIITEKELITCRQDCREIR